MIVDKLVALLGFQVERKGLDEYNSKLKGLATSTAKWVSIIYGASATLAKFAADSAEQIEKISEKIGISTSKVQEFQYAAQLAGESPDALIGALETLKRKSEDVFLGDAGAIQGFTRLGLSIRGASGYLKSADQLLEDVADRVASISNPAIKRNILSSLGISDNLLPLLERGGGAISKLRKRAGQDLYIFSPKDKDNLAQFNASLRTTGKLLDSIKNAFSAKIAPSLATIQAIINVILRTIKNIVSSDLDGFFNGILRTIEAIKNVFYILAKVFGPLFLFTLEKIGSVLSVIGRILSAVFDPIFKIIEDIAVFFGGGNSLVGEALKKIQGGDVSGILSGVISTINDSLVASGQVPSSISSKGLENRFAPPVAGNKTIAPVYNITINANDKDFANTLQAKLDPFLKDHNERLWREATIYNGGNNTI